MMLMHQMADAPPIENYSSMHQAVGTSNKIKMLGGIYSPRIPVDAETGTCTRPIRGKRVLVSADAQPADAGLQVPVPTSAGCATRAKLYEDPSPWARVRVPSLKRGSAGDPRPARPVSQKLS